MNVNVHSSASRKTAPGPQQVEGRHRPWPRHTGKPHSRGHGRTGAVTRMSLAGTTSSRSSQAWEGTHPSSSTPLLFRDPSTVAKPWRKAGRNHKSQVAEVTSSRERGCEWQGNFRNPGHVLFLDLSGSDTGVPFTFICKTTNTLLCFSVLCWEPSHNLNPKWT